MDKKKTRKYSPGIVLLLLLSLLGLAVFCLPSYSGRAPSAFLNVLAEKNIYSAAVALLAALPLVIMVITSAFPADVIKKYVLFFFMSLWLVIGYMLLFILLKTKYSGNSPSLGFFLGMGDAALLLFFTILGNMRDKTAKKHKDLVWYNGLSKIILFISLPLFTAATLGIILFHTMVFSFPVIMTIGIFAAWVSLGICAAVSVCTLLGKYKCGMLYYIAAFTSVISVMGMFIQSEFVAVIAALIASVIIAAFFTYLGNIAKRNFF